MGLGPGTADNSLGGTRSGWDGALTAAVGQVLRYTPPRMPTQQTGPYPQTQATSDCINLGLGHPAPALLPAGEFAEMAGDRLGRDPLLLQYGTPRGYLGFRGALAEWLGELGAATASADELLVTAGTSSALALCAQSLARPGQQVVCGDPTYFLARGIFESQGLEVVGVPVDAGGISVEGVREVVASDPGRVAFIYCMPTFHNPTSVTMPNTRREALVELADEYGITILADEPYNLLSYGEPPPPPLYAIDRGRNRVVSLGSFSKLLGPGVRLGWAMAGESLLGDLEGNGVLQSGGCLNPVATAVVHGLIESGFQTRHLERLNQRFAESSGTLKRALSKHLPEADFSPARGGYFAWVRLGSSCSTSDLLPAARAAGVAFTPGSRCAVTADLDSFLRLSISFYEASEIEEGVKRLADVIAEH